MRSLSEEPEEWSELKLLLREFVVLRQSMVFHVSLKCC